MDIPSKIERVKTEILFLIQGEGTLEEKEAALQEIEQFTVNNITEQQTLIQQAQAAQE